MSGRISPVFREAMLPVTSEIFTISTQTGSNTSRRVLSISAGRGSEGEHFIPWDLMMNLSSSSVVNRKKESCLGGFEGFAWTCTLLSRNLDLIFSTFCLKKVISVFMFFQKQISAEKLVVNNVSFKEN